MRWCPSVVWLTQQGCTQILDKTFEAPRALDWYPDKLAWQFNFSRLELRKLPQLNNIHELLKRENEAGSITRQEAVSMVPPLFLDVQSDHRVGALSCGWRNSTAGEKCVGHAGWCLQGLGETQ